MKIGLDARMYGPAQGGLGRYIQQLILELEKLQTDAEFVIFLRRDNWDEYQPRSSNFHKVLADIPWYGVTEQIIFPSLIKKEKIDLMHFPHWNVPLFYNRPFVVTIHDLLLLHFPTRRASMLGPTVYWFKNRAWRLILNHAVKKARHIFTVSDFSKKDIIATLHVPPEKISVTYPVPLPIAASPLQTSNFKLQAHGITKPYVLYVGVAYPHKNLDGLLRAWKLFTEKYSNTYQLVLAGKTNYFYKQLQAASCKLQAQNVIFVGFISDTDLPALYRGASLYVMPSLYEGFGLPALEALCSGVPVVSSNRTCLPEILQNAALYFDPSNSEDMAQTIFTGLTDKIMRQKLLAAAPALIARFQGKMLAKKTWEVYQNSV